MLRVRTSAAVDTSGWRAASSGPADTANLVKIGSISHWWPPSAARATGCCIGSCRTGEHQTTGRQLAAQRRSNIDCGRTRIAGRSRSVSRRAETPSTSAPRSETARLRRCTWHGDGFRTGIRIGGSPACPRVISGDITGRCCSQARWILVPQPLGERPRASQPLPPCRLRCWGGRCAHLPATASDARATLSALSIHTPSQTNATPCTTPPLR